jgi:hypothetical protein
LHRFSAQSREWKPKQDESATFADLCGETASVG